MFTVFFLVSEFTTGKVKIVVDDTSLLAGAKAAADGNIRFCLPTDQVNAPSDALIRVFLTRNILLGETSQPSCDWLIVSNCAPSFFGYRRSLRRRLLAHPTRAQQADDVRGLFFSAVVSCLPVLILLFVHL